MAEQNKQHTLDFTGQMAEKDDFLGEEVLVRAVAAPTQGGLGGVFRIATIEYGGKTLQTAFGAILSKQWEQWEHQEGSNALPAYAVIVKGKGKRYYSFTAIYKESAEKDQ
jgi:hypothetical protein